LTRLLPLPYTGRVAGKRGALFALLLLLVTPGTCSAEHEVYYRYTVLGYVKVPAGTVRPRIEVELVREKTGFSYLAEADETGFYVIVARLGDESLGEKLRLRAARGSATITARFDPADHVHERGTRVDFIGERPVETASAFAATLELFLAR
jgi:hypothetical protein